MIVPLTITDITYRIGQLMMEDPVPYDLVTYYTGLLGMLVVANLTRIQIDYLEWSIAQVEAQQAAAGC
jgi:hypothetical protein